MRKIIALGVVALALSTWTIDASVDVARSKAFLDTEDSRAQSAKDPIQGEPVMGPEPVQGKPVKGPEPNICTAIYVIIMVGFFCQMAGQYILGNKPLFLCGLCVNGVGCLAATAYSFHHGLVTHWYKGHILTDHCRGLAAAAAVMYVFIVFGLAVACGFGAYFVTAGIRAHLKEMNEATLKKSATLSSEEQRFLTSDDFKKKCAVAFKKADKDGNGTLDIAELKDVALFDLTSAQQKKVASEHLFQKAFTKCDENHDNQIDEEEFLDVMKYVRSHALAD